MKKTLYIKLVVIPIVMASCDKVKDTQVNLKTETSMKTDKPVIPSALFNDNDMVLPDNLGSLHTSAPEQSNQFDFMIGKFVCKDSLLVGGKWVASEATWETHYILNGYGVRDVYRNNRYAGESIRFFNTTKNKWDVYFFGMPGEHTGLWEGEYIDGNMVMKQERTGPFGENLMSQLTFFNITDKSFDWKGEEINLDTKTSTINWKIKAER